MSSLGKLGRQDAEPAQLQEETTFEWFGATIALRSRFNQVDLIDLSETWADIDGRNTLRVLNGIKRGLRLLIDLDDFDRFWELANIHQQGTQDLLDVFSTLMDAANTRPTRQPSDSSPGRLPTDTSSPAASPSQGFTGRPDLAVIAEDSQNVSQRVRQLAASA